MRKNKISLFIIILATNVLVVKIFKIELLLDEVLLIQAFLFSLSFLADIIQLKLSKNKKITPAHFLMINFSRILLCVVFLLPTILEYNKYNKSDNIYIYNFFIVYFIYLFHDIIFKGKKANKINM